jgi:ribokinase
MLTVFGSIIVDTLFSVPSLPKEGETILATHLFVGPGGKGANQAVAAAKSGGVVAMVGSVGNDPLAKISLNAFKDALVDTLGVQTVEGSTGSAAVMVDPEGANAISVAPEANKKTNLSQVSEERWTETTTLLMQMEIPLDEIENAIFSARRRRIRSILNLAPAALLDLAALRALDILVVNEIELDMLAKGLALDGDPPVALAKEVADFLGNTLAVTLGSRGALLVSNGEMVRAPALRIEALDTTGAGDAFCGVFAAALDRGHTLEEALQRGSIAGSLACLKTGAQESLPGADEIEAYL